MRWTASSHALGRGVFHPASVTIDADALHIAVTADGFRGGEAVTRELYGAGRFSARLRTPRAPGSLSAFFLYERDAPHADEIDIEIPNDGSRAILFTVWSAGREIAHARRLLAFDPADGLHLYEIRRESGRIRFLVDGAVLHECSGDDLPRAALDLRVSGWWPQWLQPAPGAAGVLTVRDAAAESFPPVDGTTG